jgi:hypothetical protein
MTTRVTLLVLGSVLALSLGAMKWHSSRRPSPEQLATEAASAALPEIERQLPGELRQDISAFRSADFLEADLGR